MPWRRHRTVAEELADRSEALSDALEAAAPTVRAVEDAANRLVRLIEEREAHQ